MLEFLPTQLTPPHNGAGLPHFRVCLRDWTLQYEEDAEGLQGDHNAHEDQEPSLARYRKTKIENKRKRSINLSFKGWHRPANKFKIKLAAMKWSKAKVGVNVIEIRWGRKIFLSNYHCSKSFYCIEIKGKDHLRQQSVRVVMLVPKHSAPPQLGVGLLQVRVLLRVEHVSDQALHAVWLLWGWANVVRG